MMPIAPPPQPPSRFPRWAFFPIAFVIVVFALGIFLGIWQFLTPAERKLPVAYSDFLAEVHAGHVDEIRIHDREITFRVHDPSNPTRRIVKETVGPIPDQALVASLKPDDPNLPLPKIFFEK